MKRDKVVFRVDINANRGLGHYKRCYVLAQHFLTQGWKVYFLMECPCPNAGIKTTGINFRYLFDTKNTNAKKSTNTQRHTRNSHKMHTIIARENLKIDQK